MKTVAVTGADSQIGGREVRVLAGVPRSWAWRGIFTDHRLGLSGYQARAKASNSLFIKNDVTVKIDGDEFDDWSCADLVKPTFLRNGKDLIGPRCSS